MTNSPDDLKTDVSDKDAAQDAPQNNFERLAAHLPEDSLAAKLVSAYAAPAAGALSETMRTVIENRLAELKASYDETTDQ